MPAAVWSGTISFSLVSVPVQLYSAAESTGPVLHNYHEADGGRVRTKRVWEADGQEVAFTDIARGIEVGDDMVVITDADLDARTRKSRSQRGSGRAKPRDLRR